jgi:hypothetical protein
MQIDIDKWQRLRAAAANAEHDGPTFADLQAAIDRRARERIELERFRADGVRGYASGPPITNAHAGEQILAGVGGHGPDDVKRAFDASVRELEQRVVEAEREVERISERRRQCSETLARLRGLVEDCRTWADAQGIVLPGAAGRVVPPPGMVGARSVHIPEPPADARSIISPSGSGAPPAARGGMIARMMQGLLP